MKYLISFLLLLSLTGKSQTCTTTVVYDNIETSTWTGSWFGNTLTEGYYNNASVSATNSAVLYGNGSGASAIEQDWYVLPNITGLNSAYTYQFKLRLGSYVFSNPTSTSRGVDGADLVEIQISTNGEISYTSEIRITGNNNATWDYNTNGIITKTANGTLTTYSPTAGGSRTTTGDGYSDITLTLTGITQLAVDVLCRVNSNGEEWWLDNMQLIEIAPCAPLPIELSSFNATLLNKNILIDWETSLEINNDYFILEKSINGINWKELHKVEGQGTKYTSTQYTATDSITSNHNYYRLKQIDYDQNYKYYSPIYLYAKYLKEKTIVMVIDLLGNKIQNLETYSGIYVAIYEDGTVCKFYK